MSEEESKVESLALDGSFVVRSTLPLTSFGETLVSTSTKLGRRRSQEDRLVACPKLFNLGTDADDRCGFFGVFDGTVGATAAEFIHRRLLPNFATSKAFTSALKFSSEGWAGDEAKGLIKEAIIESFELTDTQLIEHAGRVETPYTSSTAVVAVVTGPMLTIAHVGDSKAAIGSVCEGQISGKFLTLDHKPDTPAELARIEASGGILTYLHGRRPFIRGGDFTERKAKGDRPMQLNYSRAFGGRDLKPYGLSCEPDILQIPLSADDVMIVLGSDGLWDVMNPDIAMSKATDARLCGRDPASVLVDYALEQHEEKGSADNVTAVVVCVRELIV